jgi:hypothetical protein
MNGGARFAELINTGVGHLMRHNQMVFGIDCGLHVLANNPGTPGLHRTCIRVGQRGLLVALNLLPSSRSNLTIEKRR